MCFLFFVFVLSILLSYGWTYYYFHLPTYLITPLVWNNDNIYAIALFSVKDVKPQRTNRKCVKWEECELNQQFVIKKVVSKPSCDFLFLNDLQFYTTELLLKKVHVQFCTPFQQSSSRLHENYVASSDDERFVPLLWCEFFFLPYRKFWSDFSCHLSAGFQRFEIKSWKIVGFYRMRLTFFD